MTASDPDEGMEPFAALVGEWATEATHVALEGLIRGRVRFAWAADGRFLVQHAEYDHPDVPDAVSVIGRLDGETDLAMHYFDSRGVHRLYGIAFDGSELRVWRDAPGFAQRSVVRLGADGSTLEGSWELSEKDQGFRLDMTVAYRRLA
jgi:hypothetical protein